MIGSALKDVAVSFEFVLFLIAVNNVYQSNQESVNQLEVGLVSFSNHDDKWVNTSEPDFNEFVLIEDNTFTVINTEVVKSIALVCKAPYPIYWIIVDAQPTVLDGIFINPRVVFSDNDTNIQIEEFQSYLQVDNEPSLTGSYMCRSAKNENSSKDVHIYVPGVEDEKRNLSNAGKQLTVGINGGESVVLPCKVTKPSISLSLLIQKGEDWQPVPFSSEFSPRRGFTIRKDDLPQLTGTYKCLANDSKEEVIVHVKEEFNQPQFPIYEYKNGTAKWKRSQYGDGITCCSNGEDPPDLFVSVCNNKPECDIRQLALMRIENMTSKTSGLFNTRKSIIVPCTETAQYLLAQPFYMRCVGEGINVSGAYVTYFVPPQSKRTNYVPFKPDDSNFAENTTIRMMVMKLVDNNEFVNVNPHLDMYEGESYAFDCCGLHYHHAVGRIQRIGWKNGTFTPVPVNDYGPWTPITKDFCYTYLLSAEDNVTLIGDINMTYFECILPLWNDTKPIVRRINLNIREQASLVLATNGPENITYEVNQGGLLTLDCDLSQGAPITNMTWKKDGYNVNRTDKYWSAVDQLYPMQPTGTYLLFMRAVKDIEGKYECTIVNKFGTVQKSFTVKVNPKSYLEYWIALAVFGCLSLKLCICGLRFSHMQKRYSKKQVEPKGKLFYADN